jgi:hypothetical protein
VSSNENNNVHTYYNYITTLMKMFALLKKKKKHFKMLLECLPEVTQEENCQCFLMAKAMVFKLCPAETTGSTGNYQWL